jgi:hypothetical protein
MFKIIVVQIFYQNLKIAFFLVFYIFVFYNVIYYINLNILIELKKY